MKAACFTSPGKLELKESKDPEITNSQQVLIRVDAASICGSDLKILSVPPAHPAKQNVIMGHEFTGVVVETGGDVEGIKTRDRVVVEPNIPCGTCEYCRSNLPHMCSNLETIGETLDGGFADYCVVPRSQVHAVSSSVSAKEAVFAEPLSCVVGAFSKMAILPGDSVLIHGAGPIGLLFAQSAKAWGARVLLSEPSAFRREIAAKCQPEAIIDPGKSDILSSTREFTSIGFDLVVDTVGTLLPASISLARRGGKIILFGINDQHSGTVRQYEITRNDLQVFGSFIGTGVFPRSIRMIERKVIDVAALVSHEISLSEINHAVELLRAGKAVKVIIVP